MSQGFTQSKRTLKSTKQKTLRLMRNVSVLQKWFMLIPRRDSADPILSKAHLNIHRGRWIWLDHNLRTLQSK